MPTALPIRDDRSPADLRRLARRERDGRVSARLVALANALDGLPREEAARLAGVTGRTLRDWVLRYNAEGLGALTDRPRPGRPCALDEGQQATLKALILRGPDPKRDGCWEWRIADLRRIAHERFGVAHAETGMLRLVKGLNLSRQKARPRPGRPYGAGPLQKGLPDRLTAAAAQHPEAELWFMDEARVGQNSRTTHVWYEKGVRPRGARDVGFASTRLFGAVCPARDAAVALVLPEVSIAAMDLFLAELGRRLPERTHAVLVLDQAGWHTSRRLDGPANLTLVHLPPYSPELKPVEKLWRYLRERFFSHRVLPSLAAVIDAACEAWNRLVAEPGRIRSLTAFPWLPPSIVTS